MPPTARRAAEILIAAGLSVIPIKTDASKAPLVNWKEFQGRIAEPDELDVLFHSPCGIATVCGAISGNLEVVDIEAEADQAELAALIEEHLPGLLPTLPQVVTPTGGRHIFYLCSAISGNQKLAMSPAGKVLIETRGEGGYVLTVGSPAECHPSGKLYQIAVSSLTRIPTITPEQRDILLACCRSFTRLIVSDSDPRTGKPPSRGGKRPGDDYNERGDALSVLLKYGWKVEGRKNGHAYLRRPGKDHGISASFGKVAANTLYVFSTNAAPFEFERAYDAFGVYCRLEAGGNIELAAKQLGELGYGERPAPRHVPPPAPAAGVVDSYEPEPVKPVTDDNLGLVYATMKPTEDNVAQVFEARYKGELRYCDTWGKWLKWDAARWGPERTLLALDYSRSLARRVNITGANSPAKSSFARGVEFFCRASRTFATESGDWDRNTFQLNTTAGTYDLQTGQMGAHRQEDYITKITKVAPAEGPHPVFDMFLRDITLNDDGLAEYLQRALGACLSGAIQDNFLLFWYGTGQNGKNTFGDLITWILGDYAKVIPIDTLIANKNASHPTTLANLRGLRLAVCSEVSEGSYWDESRVKSLTGDTEISARFMRQDFFEFPRTHKHLVYGNHRPMLRIVDPGMKSRLHIVPFKAYFPPDAKDPLMRQKLEAEAPAILQWLINGHARWLEDGYLKKCSAVQTETDSYFEAQSTNEAWLADCCIEGDGRAASAKELYQNFKQWKEARGEGVISQNRWGEWMGQRYLKRRTGAGFVYDGLDVKPQSVLDYQA